MILPRDDALASGEAVELGDLAERPVLLHERAANPYHYDAVLALYRREGLEPRVRERALSTDLTYLPVVQGEAVAIVGESVRASLPATLAWVPLPPPASIEIHLLTRRRRHSPALARVLEIAAETASRLGWLAGTAQRQTV